MANELESYLKQMKRRIESFKPAWDPVNEILRKDFKEQLETSKGPDGKPFKPLSEASKKRPRRSDRPYDTQERETWDALVNKDGGTIKKTKDTLSIKIDEAGGYQANTERPIGISDKAADDITEELANYIAGED